MLENLGGLRIDGHPRFCGFVACPSSCPELIRDWRFKPARDPDENLTFVTLLGREFTSPFGFQTLWDFHGVFLHIGIGGFV